MLKRCETGLNSFFVFNSTYGHREGEVSLQLSAYIRNMNWTLQQVYIAYCSKCVYCVGMLQSHLKSASIGFDFVFQICWIWMQMRICHMITACSIKLSYNYMEKKSHTTLHRESKKTRHQTLGHNFTNHYPIFKIFSLADSVVNLQQILV